MLQPDLRTRLCLNHHGRRNGNGNGNKQPEKENEKNKNTQVMSEGTSM
jgi:hypothetical protein